MEGLEWSVGAISNATWTGARLRDVLLAAGVPERCAVDASCSTRHVQLEGADKDMTGATYGASIPIAKVCVCVVMLRQVLLCSFCSSAS